MTTASDIFSEDLDWLFWRAARPRIDSAWIGHIPFAHYLVAKARPRLIVELGTFSGASYAGFCEAVVKCNLPTRCFAVDTWAGDDHIGGYGEQIHAELAGFNTGRYAGFSTLLRMTFDAAIERFDDGSIDVLHIDGFHTYEAVRHDFESWQSKLSSRAIVLFHDTAERKADFGVWRYWAELRQHYPGFEFVHSHGLGVLKVGADLEGDVLSLFSLEGGEIEKVQARFLALGEAVRMTGYAAKMHNEVAQLKSMLQQGSGRATGRR